MWCWTENIHHCVELDYLKKLFVFDAFYLDVEIKQPKAILFILNFYNDIALFCVLSSSYIYFDNVCFDKTFHWNCSESSCLFDTWYWKASRTKKGLFCRVLRFSKQSQLDQWFYSQFLHHCTVSPTLLFKHCSIE